MESGEKELLRSGSKFINSFYSAKSPLREDGMYFRPETQGRRDKGWGYAPEMTVGLTLVHIPKTNTKVHTQNTDT